MPAVSVLLIVTALIFLSHYCFILKFRLGNPHRHIILACLFGFSQIILTQLGLGLIGELYLPVLILTNVGLAVIILVSTRVFKGDIFLLSKQGFKLILEGLRGALTVENVLLSILLGFVFLWMAVAIYFFAPRNGDELWYHLPPIYEYIINHKIFLLPLDYNLRFVFPQNAELLFMWPAIFLHSQQFIQGVQMAALLWGMIVIYGLARILCIKRSLSFFISLLFPLTPVVLFQLASCYIDIVIAVFFLTALYCACMFYKSGRLVYLYAAGLAAGILWGMKYNQLLLILLLLPFLCRKGVPAYHWAGVAAVFLIAGGFWYLRNICMFCTPIYPPMFSFGPGVRVYGFSPKTVQFIGFITNVPSKWLAIWKDVGLGSLHGGYGLVFWGLAFPAWVYILIKSILKRNKFVFWIHFFVLIGMGQLLFTTLRNYNWIARYAIFTVALGFLALGQTMMVFDRYVSFIKVVKGLSIFFVFLAIVHLCNALDGGPSYRIDVPVKDFLSGRYISRQSYGSCPFWGLMDYLTIKDSKGLSYYINCSKADIAYIYGTKLQNRVWNFQENKSSLPDGFVVYYISWPQFVAYFNSKFHLKKTLVGSDYRFIQQEGNALLYIRKDFFLDPQKQELLDNYNKITKD